MNRIICDKCRRPTISVRAKTAKEAEKHAKENGWIIKKGICICYKCKLERSENVSVL